MSEISDLLTRWDASIASMRTLADEIAGSVVTPPPPPPVVTATLNPADKHAELILSNGDLTATRAAGNGWVMARATVGKSAGKWFFEYTQGTRSTNGMFGLANAAAPLSGHPGVDNNGCGYSYADGTLFINSQQVSAGPGAFWEGHVVGVAVDLDAKTASFSLNGGSYFARSLSALNAGPYFPAIGVYGGGGSGSMNFGGAPFRYAPPAGFSAWQ